jgi:hypothetical protein
MWGLGILFIVSRFTIRYSYIDGQRLLSDLPIVDLLICIKNHRAILLRTRTVLLNNNRSFTTDSYITTTFNTQGT